MSRELGAERHGTGSAGAAGSRRAGVFSALRYRWAAPVVRALRGGLRDVAAFVYPHRCPACGAEADPERVLCSGCWIAVPRAELIVCTRCLGFEREPVGCVRHPGFRAGVAWVYDERAAAVIGAFKYGERTDLAAPLAGEMARLPLPLARPDFIVAVPLHPARRRERGYNQAELLAERLSERLGVPWLPDALERWRPTPAQARLGARERRTNLAGAIRARQPGTLMGRRVLVVDDVITTGATLDACLEVLRAGGAEAAACAVAWAQ